MNATTEKPRQIAICQPADVPTLKSYWMFAILEPGEPEEGHDREDHKQRCCKQARDREHPLVHLAEAASGEARLLPTDVEDRGIGTRVSKLALLEGLEAFQTMLVEDHDEGQPDDHPGQDVEGADRHRAVPTDDPVQEQGQADGQLEEEAKASNPGCLLICEMIDSHALDAIPEKCGGGMVNPRMLPGDRPKGFVAEWN